MKLVIVSLAAALLLLNCRKSRITPGADARTALIKQPATVVAENGESFHFLYDEHGQLLVHTAADAVHYYKPGNDHLLTLLLKESNEKFSYKHAQRDAYNRIMKLEKFKQDIPESTIEFTYNVSGYLSKRKVIDEGLVQEFIYTYDAGNLVKIEEYVNAALTSTMLLEYYDNRFNTVGIDLLDFKQIGFVTDAQFGNQSKNLVKSLKAISTDGQTGFSFQYFYRTDVNGYVKSMEIETNNETLKKYNFIFQ
ncbi:hypothetical protein [Lacibacter sp.]|uniref:hypothetical protein n=1 Tax=Lacibacter sp. TaxID=1915409 RepID=UPI002B4B2590|nr:hypothetical protein [Lacibacter sp.]HLP36436.1 hypothetical protein [Lacibacter sp.]